MKSSAIAIVGMAGRFPGARNIDEFWRNLRDGVESIRSLSDAELLAAGVAPDVAERPDYVKAAAVLDDVDMFDASFFGFSPRDAAIMDPQHRHFLECAWEAIENAGHPPDSFCRFDRRVRRLRDERLPAPQLAQQPPLDGERRPVSDPTDRKR